MADLQLLISFLNLLGLGGVGIFLYYLFKGLKERIKTLTELAMEQHKTLEAVRARAEEMDRLKDSYKQALLDFEDMGHKLEQRRNELVKELEAANQRKDEELAKLAHLKLEEIELKKKSLERLPQLEDNLTKAVSDLERQLHIISSAEPYPSQWTSQSILPLLASTSRHSFITPASSKWDDYQSLVYSTLAAYMIQRLHMARNREQLIRKEHEHKIDANVTKSSSEAPKEADESKQGNG